MLLRRDFIKQGLASVALANPLLASMRAEGATVSKIVDAHCHIFNGDDLPIVQFIEKVALPQQSEFKQYATKYGHAIRFVVRFMAKWIRKNAPSADQEVDLLDAIKQGTASARTENQIIQDEISHLTELIDELMSIRIRGGSFTFQERLISAYLPGIVVGLLHREAYPGIYKGKGPLDNSDHAFDIDRWQPAPALAEKLYYDGAGPLSLYLRWGLMFQRYRFELADELDRIHGPRVHLLLPALVDYSNWLDDEHNVRLASQVKVMGRIARRDGPVRVHSYAPFDPLREALHRAGPSQEESPLALVKRAVLTEGSIGVKVYPPMGFLPFDNAKKLFAGDFPLHLELEFRKRLSAALDTVLGDLYRWCVDEQVPILAHAANSNGADQGYSLRASPDNWAAVAKNFPGIRISLAHFGDFDAGFETSANPNPRLEQTWEWKMATLVRGYPASNIYIDLSYLNVALLAPDNNVRSEVRRMLREVKKEYPTISERMLFGTDWVMFGKEQLFPPVSRSGQYADRVAQLLSECTFTDAEIERIMSANAGRFIGLDLPATAVGNRGRLTNLYNASGLDSGWMNEFPIQTG